MIISFLVVSHKRRNETIGALDSICRTIINTDYRDFKGEIIVLINGGDFDYFNFIRSYMQSIEESGIALAKCYYSKLNLGAAGGRNYVYKHSQGDVLVFIDDDAEIINESDLIKDILEEKKQNKKLGIIAFRSVNKDWSIRYEEIPVRPSKALTKKKVAKFIAVGFVLFRDSVYSDNFLFPENLFIYMEEYYLSMRLISRGNVLIYNPNLVLEHKKSHQGRLNTRDYYIKMASNKIYIYRLANLRLLFYCNLLLWSLWSIYRSKELLILLDMWKRLRDLIKSTEQKYYFQMDKEAMRYIKKYGVCWYLK